MRREFVFPAGVWPALRLHLLGQGSEEQLAFLLAGVARDRGWLRLLVREAVPVPADAFEQQTSTHLIVRPAFSQAVLQRCYTEGLSLIEIHSHPFVHHDVAFSATDLAGEALKFRYVARKIPHIYHATMVVGQESLDAHLWDRRRRQAVAIDRVRLLDQPIIDLLPGPDVGRKSPNGKPAAWLHRQVLALGIEGQRRLQALCVGVVGCGGTGSAVVQMLAHLGIGSFVLVDPDVVESSNLNRLVGATPGDARRARAKVHVMRRLVRQLNRSAQARALAMPLNDLRAVTALKGVDMLFGCTDNHSSRLILNHLAVQYLVPCLDLGTGLQAQENNRLTAAGGQVRLVQPGGACLACMDGFDRVQARDDLLPAVARQRQAARGYVQDSDLPTPAVLFLNNAVAALAVAEFVNLWTGYRTATPLLYFDLLNSRLTVAEAERRTSCIACGRGASLALGDLEPLPATETGEVPLSVPGPVQNCQPAYS